MYKRLLTTLGVSLVAVYVHLHFVLHHNLVYIFTFVFLNLWYTSKLRREVARTYRSMGFLTHGETLRGDVNIILKECHWFLGSYVIAMAQIVLTFLTVFIRDFSITEDYFFMAHILMIDFVVYKCFRTNYQNKQMYWTILRLEREMFHQKERVQKTQRLSSTLKPAAPPSSESCSICFDAFKTPVELQCGHYYCEPCILKWFYVDQDHRCPYCRKKHESDYSFVQ